VSARCPICDRPCATSLDWQRVAAGEGAHLCWGACSPVAVDWRARALAAEQERDALRAIVEGEPARIADAVAAALTRAHVLQDVALMFGDDLTAHPGSGRLLASKPVRGAP